MPQVVKAVITPSGHVHLLEPLSLCESRRAFVTVLDEKANAVVLDPSLLLSEGALSDWNREEEDAAWAYLQQEP
jgi:hypothetical protein